jgi:hypothetical protein
MSGVVQYCVESEPPLSPSRFCLALQKDLFLIVLNKKITTVGCHKKDKSVVYGSSAITSLHISF